MDTIAKDHAYRTLAAHGLAVGLSDGLMGNSEVGSVTNFPILSLHLRPPDPRWDTQPSEHRRGAHRMAGHRPDRRRDQEAAVPQERDDPRELRARQSHQRAAAPPRPRTPFPLPLLTPSQTPTCARAR